MPLPFPSPSRAGKASSLPAPTSAAAKQLFPLAHAAVGSATPLVLAVTPGHQPAAVITPHPQAPAALRTKYLSRLPAAPEGIMTSTCCSSDILRLLVITSNSWWPLIPWPQAVGQRHIWKAALCLGTASSSLHQQGKQLLLDSVLQHRAV